jgi:membrane associated rhomboid family serine protease
MFFPYGTDAPLYYRPLATVALIGLNVLVFLATFSDPAGSTWALQFGHGLHPLQWITSNFIHGNFFHLLGNMICLWSFGLVVEGKLGWYRTLAVFFGIGAAQGAVEQVFMLFSSGGEAFGASAIIYGFMAMSLIWAPENEMYCVAVFWIVPWWFEIKIAWLVALLLGIDLLIVGLSGLAMSSSLLHVVGAGLGFAVAIWMLKTKRVDCENWDIFSVRAGRQSLLPSQWREKEKQERAEEHQRRQEQLQERRDEALEKIRQYIRDRQSTAALKTHQLMAAKVPHWGLPEPDLFDLITSLGKERCWAEAVALMKEYLSDYSDRAALVRLNLAQILLLKERQPAAALKVLGKIDAAALDPDRQQFLGQLRAKAEQLRGQESYELSDEEW